MRVNEWQGTLRPEFLVERISLDQATVSEPLVCGPHCPHAREDRRTGPGRQESAQTCADDVSLSFARGRDLRDHPGRMSALAQVLASAEPTVMLTCSAAGTLAELYRRLPLDALCDGRLHCVSRATGAAERYLPFIHLSLTMSNLAWTSFIRSTEKSRAASPGSRISRSSGGVQPRKIR